VNDLALARRLDWRFLLPTAELGRVLCADADPALVEALEHHAAGVASLDGSARARGCDGAVLGSTAPDAIRRAAEAVAPGGWLYVEASGQSHRAATRALAESGFGAVSSYWHWPRFDDCGEIVPLASRAAVRLALSRRRASTASRVKALAAGALASAGRLDRTLPAVSVLGRRSGAERPEAGFAATLLAEIAGRWSGAGERSTSVLVTPRFPTSRHVVALVVPDGERDPALVVKIPRLAEDTGGVEHEAEVLRSLEGVPGVPRALALARAHGRCGLVETAVRGVPLNPRAVRHDAEASVRTVRAWLERLPTAAPDREAAERLIGRPLAAAESLEPRLVERTLAAVAPLAGSEFPLVLEHGDVSHPNLVLQPDGSLAVIDWELAEPRGLPLNDLCFFLAYVAACRDGADSADAVATSFLRAFVGRDAWGGRIVLEEARRLGLPSGLVEPLFLAVWARDAARFPARAGLGAGSQESRPHVRWRLAVEHVGALGWV